MLDEAFGVLQRHEIGGHAIHIHNKRKGRLIAVLLHLALRRLLRRRLCGAADAVQAGLLGHHVNHHEADGTLVCTHAGEAGEQITASVIVQNSLALRGAVFILIAEVQIAVHVLAFVVELRHDKIFRLHTVYPGGQLLNGIGIALACGAVHHHGPCGLRQRKAAQVTVGGDDPVGPPGVIQLKAVIRQAGEGRGREARIKQQVLPQVSPRLILDGVAVHIFHVLRVCGGHRHISRCAVHIGQPLEQA